MARFFTCSGARVPFSRLVIAARDEPKPRRSRGRGWRPHPSRRRIPSAFRDIASPEGQARVLEAFAGVTDLTSVRLAVRRSL
jgi:hypothetical protein